MTKQNKTRTANAGSEVSKTNETGSSIITDDTSFFISACCNGVTDTRVILEQPTWEAMVKMLTTAKIGEKAGSYFLRGQCDGTRKDENMKSVSFVILDGDTGIDAETGSLKPCVAPPLRGACAVLKKHELAFIAYTTHTTGLIDVETGIEAYKWRILLPVAGEDWKGCLRWVLKLLADAGVGIEHVSEMDSLSQAWFYPRVDKHRKHLFESYSNTGNRLIETLGLTVNLPSKTASLISTPGKNSDPILEELSKHALLKILKPDKADITCPWVAEHTNGVDSGTTYFFPDTSKNGGKGGFKCHHSHCASKGIKDLITFLKPTPVTTTSEVIDRYVFVKTANIYYDLQTHVTLVSGALNFTHGAEEFYDDNGDLLPCSSWLRKQPNKLIVDDFGWMPCRYDKPITIIPDKAATLVNTWKGFAITPIKGNVQPWLDHVTHLFPDETERNNFIDRLAYDIQHPDKKCNWHIVILGVRGAGKDAVLSPLFTIFGEAGATIGNKDAKGDYDDGYTQTKLVCLSEVNNMDGDAMEDLKRKATSGSTAFFILNPKGRKKIKQANLWSLYLITNHKNALQLAPDERRFYVLEASVAMTGDQKSAYFQDWLDRQGAPYLFQYLLDRDLSNFDPNTLPSHTPTFNKMVSATEKDYEKILQEWLDDGLHGFNEGAVLANDLRSVLKAENVRVKMQEVEDWLMNKGYTKYPAQIQKRVNGVRKIKSRSYRLNSALLTMSAVKLYDYIDSIENKEVRDVNP